MHTLDLDPDWGAINLLEEVEASFGIKIEDAIVEQIETPGAALLKADPGKLPVGVETLGDLVTRAVHLNAQVLTESSARFP